MIPPCGTVADARSARTARALTAVVVAWADEDEAETVAVGGVQVRSPAGYLVNSSVKLPEDDEALPVVLVSVLAVAEVVAFEETLADVVAPAVVFSVAAADVDVALTDVDFAVVVFPTATFGAGSRSKSKPSTTGPASKESRPITLDNTHILAQSSLFCSLSPQYLLNIASRCRKPCVEEPQSSQGHVKIGQLHFDQVSGLGHKNYNGETQRL